MCVCVCVCIFFFIFFSMMVYHRIVTVLYRHEFFKYYVDFENLFH